MIFASFAKMKNPLLNLSLRTKLLFLLILIILVAIPSGFSLHNSITSGSEDKTTQSENKDEVGKGEIAGVSITESSSPTSTNIKSTGSSKNPNPTPTPTLSPSTGQTDQTQPTAPTTNNYVAYQYPISTPKPTNIIIYNPTPTLTTQKPNKEVCDAKRAALDSDYYFAVSDSQRRYKNEVTALAQDYGRRGIDLSSGMYQNALKAVEDKYSEELDHLEADNQNKINLLIAEGCSF